MYKRLRFVTIWLAVTIAVWCQPLLAGDPSDLRDRLEKRVYEDSQGHKLPYRLFVPRCDIPRPHPESFPLILFLHGAGERGDDNVAQLRHAQVLRFVSDEVQARQPCMLVAPQCPKEHKWVEVPWNFKEPHATPAEPVSGST